jgi:putative pyruvate formate lyase activating enzyme
MKTRDKMIPEYIKLYESGKLKEIRDRLEESIISCKLCPWHCKTDRTKDKTGVCKGGYLPEISSYNLHYGEEPPISGEKGSGTIFFTGCQLRCVFCQNYPISQLRNGKQVEFGELAEIMLNLQSRGAHNINLVTPTPWVFQIVKSLYIAIGKGLKIPIVWNTSGYEDEKTLKLIEGVVDIYLTDIKYSDDKSAKKLSRANNYFNIAKKGVKEMFRQVGNLIIKSGIAKKGLIVRHLVLPDNLSGSDKVLKFLRDEISKEVFISLMSQYFPAYKAIEIKSLNRPVNKKEYDRVLELLEKYGLTNGWIQPL